MIYYKVKKMFDQYPRFLQRRAPNFAHIISGAYIGEELYTAAELKKYCYDIRMFDIITISKRKTYFCFGARFEKRRIKSND